MSAIIYCWWRQAGSVCESERASERAREREKSFRVWCCCCSLIFIYFCVCVGCAALPPENSVLFFALRFSHRCITVCVSYFSLADFFRFRFRYCCCSFAEFSCLWFVIISILITVVRSVRLLLFSLLDSWVNVCVRACGAIPFFVVSHEQMKTVTTTAAAATTTPTTTTALAATATTTINTKTTSKTNKPKSKKWEWKNKFSVLANPTQDSSKNRNQNQKRRAKRPPISVTAIVVAERFFFHFVKLLKWKKIRMVYQLRGLLR